MSPSGKALPSFSTRDIVKRAEMSPEVYLKCGTSKGIKCQLKQEKIPGVMVKW